MSTISKWKIIKGKNMTSFCTEINTKLVVFTLIAWFKLCLIFIFSVHFDFESQLEGHFLYPGFRWIYIALYIYTRMFRYQKTCIYWSTWLFMVWSVDTILYILKRLFNYFTTFTKYYYIIDLRIYFIIY